MLVFNVGGLYFSIDGTGFGMIHITVYGQNISTDYCIVADFNIAENSNNMPVNFTLNFNIWPKTYSRAANEFLDPTGFYQLGFLRSQYVILLFAF